MNVSAIVWAAVHPVRCPADRATLIALARVAKPNNETDYISFEALAAMMSCSGHTVSRSMNRLLDKGPVELVNRSPHLGSTYRLIGVPAEGEALTV